MSTNPAEALAMAPVVRFARFESLGREEEWVGTAVLSAAPMVSRRFERATFCRKALRPVKYIAEPKPVRRAEGRVPRQNEERPPGDWAIERIVLRREAWPDCWTRVLRRSAGWRRTAERIPEPRPAVKLFKC